MKRIAFLLSAFFLSMCAYAQRTLLDDGWNFRLDGQTEWQPVNLPHDWSILGAFDEKAPSGNDGGYLPTGLGWYRRTLNYTGKEKHLRLHFEGVYMNSEVRLNGQLVGGHPYGYVPFVTEDLVPHLQKGGNTLEVRVDNSQQKNCRWYSGSGIYRHVWLEAYDDVHTEPFGIGITTAGVTGGHATVRAEIALRNESAQTQETLLRMRFDDVAGTVDCKVKLPAHSQLTAPLTLSLSNVEMPSRSIITCLGSICICTQKAPMTLTLAIRSDTSDTSYKGINALGGLTSTLSDGSTQYDSTLR